ARAGGPRRRGAARDGARLGAVRVEILGEAPLAARAQAARAGLARRHLRERLGLRARERRHLARRLPHDGSRRLGPRRLDDGRGRRDDGARPGARGDALGAASVLDPGLVDLAEVEVLAVGARERERHELLAEHVGRLELDLARREEGLDDGDALRARVRGRLLESRGRDGAPALPELDEETIFLAELVQARRTPGGGV